LSHFELFDAVR